MGYAYGYRYGYGARGASPAVEEPGETLGPNLLYNSSCDSEMGGWQGATYTADNRLGFDFNLNVQQSDIEGLEPGKTYRLSMDVVTDEPLRVALSGSDPSFRNIPRLTSGGWTGEFIWSAIGGQTATLTLVDLFENAAGWMDNIELREVIS